MMAANYRIETYDAGRVRLSELLRSQPDFLHEEEGTFHLGPSPAQVLFSVKEEENHVSVCQHVTTKDTDALLGLLIRRILLWNDHVVISEQ